jgi:methylphosphotriester-DNA--protein-cysteine methyltransferase
MAQSRIETLANIRQYAANARELYQERMGMDMDAYNTETRLERTIQELQKQIEGQKAALERVIYIFVH